MNENNVDDKLVVGFWEKPFKVVKADSGGIRFRIPGATIRRRCQYSFHLLKKSCPHTAAYSITLDESSVLFDAMTGQRCNFRIRNLYQNNFHDFWVTWFNDEILIGVFNRPPLIAYSAGNINRDKELIGFVKFETTQVQENDWNVQSTSEVFMKMAVPKHITGGELRWIQMRSNDTLPTDALIGGFENEPIYIARATHRGSLCPGKYVKSKQLAYVPWGHAEHAKSEFEVLCGYDALWLKGHSNKIPENAFIAGYSEMHREPLFIGRARVNNCLLVGKVHLLYKTCYLPYCEKEVERAEYEVLVAGNSVRRGDSLTALCYMKLNMQPCV